MQTVVLQSSVSAVHHVRFTALLRIFYFGYWVLDLKVQVSLLVCGESWPGPSALNLISKKSFWRKTLKSISKATGAET